MDELIIYHLSINYITFISSRLWLSTGASCGDAVSAVVIPTLCQVIYSCVVYKINVFSFGGWTFECHFKSQKFYRADTRRVIYRTPILWSVHFKHTSWLIVTLTRTSTQSDIIWTIIIKILYRSLNDQENNSRPQVSDRNICKKRSRFAIRASQKYTHFYAVPGAIYL